MSSCLFCKIVAGEIPSKKVYEDEHVFAFRDIQPMAQTHVLFVPKVHARSLMDKAATPELVSHVVEALRSYARDQNLTGYRVVMNTEASGGQTVFHLHAHLISGRQLSGAFA